MSTSFPYQPEESFSQRLKELRLKKGLSQGALAEKIGVIYQAVSNFEAGRNMPSFSVFVRLAESLGCSLDYLAGRSDSPKVHKPRKGPVDGQG